DLPSLLVQRVGRVKFTTEQLEPAYLLHWLRSPAFRNAIDPGRSNGVPHISPKDVERIAFTPPPLATQHRIVAYLDRLNSQVKILQLLQTNIEKELDALMPSILARAFAGEL